MHQQIKASPDDTAENIRRIVAALAAANVNIEAIAPDFDPPHVRVLVEHNEPFDPSDTGDAFNRALVALSDEGLEPEIKSSLLVTMPNKPKALKTALDGLARQGYSVESILVLPATDPQEGARVSFGVARSTIAGWDQEVEGVTNLIQGELGGLP